ncbi:hypothetical protein LTR10_009178 [Elasticomyces elasticus]|nr:hypothetical protein LTR10_009178 [Elasticomyces elasticus]KAK4971720.1 hypothetical protein LTR42_007448 [Elasticomyces elasticus]
MATTNKTELNGGLASTSHSAKASKVDGMANSHLGRLSAELRNDIYHLALLQPEPIKVRWSLDRTLKPESLTSTSPTPNPTALLSTCKAMNEDCSKMMYHNNTFLFECKADGTEKIRLPTRFFELIGPTNRIELRSCIVHLDSYSSMTGPYCTSALEAVIRVAEALPQITFECRVIIEMPGTQKYELVVQCNDMPGSFDALVCEKELRLKGRTMDDETRAETKLLAALKGARERWEAKTRYSVQRIEQLKRRFE